MINNPKYIVVHTSDVSSKLVYDQYESINKYHRDERLFPKSVTGSNVGYTRLYTGGKRYITKQDWEEGAHCNQCVTEDGVVHPPGTFPEYSMNLQSIGLCVGFDGDIEMMPEVELGLLKEDILYYMAKYNIPPERVLPHRHFNTAKTCPGSLITDDFIKSLTVKPVEVKSDILEAKLTVWQKILSIIKFILKI